jgi:hypothetical protein
MRDMVSRKNVMPKRRGSSASEDAVVSLHDAAGLRQVGAVGRSRDTRIWLAATGRIGAITERAAVMRPSWARTAVLLGKARRRNTSAARMDADLRGLAGHRATPERTARASGPATGARASRRSAGVTTTAVAAPAAARDEPHHDHKSADDSPHGSDQARSAPFALGQAVPAHSITTRSPDPRPKVSGSYISSAFVGGTTKSPGVVARDT